MLELGGRKSFGENIGFLFQGGNVPGFNAMFGANVGAEEVVLESEVFVLGGHLGNIHQGQAALIVLKDSGANQAGVEEL